MRITLTVARGKFLFSIMQTLRVVGTISLILSFSLVICCCVTGKFVSNDDQVSPEEANFKAEAVPQGIMLTFDNIPEEIDCLFISFQDVDPNTEYQINPEILFSYSVIGGSPLEQVKKTGRVIIPFVKAGQKYFISVDFQKNNDQYPGEWTHWMLAECVPYSGIYSSYKDIRLMLNRTKTGLTLPYEPVFSEEVQYSFPKYEYVVTVYSTGNNANMSYSFGRQANSLTWNFEPAMTEELKKNNNLERGDYSAFVRAFCHVIYDNITWNVELAKTNVFIYSFRG